MVLKRFLVWSRGFRIRNSNTEAKMQAQRMALVAPIIGTAVCITALFCCRTPPRMGAQGPVFIPKTVVGRVSFIGHLPPPKRWSIPAESRCPDDRATTPSVIVGADGGLANVVVSVALDPQTDGEENAPAVLEYRSCEHVPKVIAIIRNQPVLFRNADAITHNVRAFGVSHPQFNIGLARGDESLQSFDANAGAFVELQCDLHPWETAYVAIFTHPHFAVTDEKGAFSLTNIPDGTYHIEAWHYGLGTRRAEVQVLGGRAGDVEIYFDAGNLDKQDAGLLR